MARGPQVPEQRRRRGAGAGAAPKDGQQRVRTADSATLEDQCHPRKVFVGGLPHKTTTQQLREHFSHFGAIVDAVVLRWPDGRSRGFGYVTFATASSAASALGETHRIGGRQIDTKRAVPGTNKLFVGGLPQNCAATELREHFEAFGVVSDAVVMIDPATSRSRGFGFVCFLPGQEGAASVAAALERYEHHRIRGKWIEVKSAVSPHKLATAESAPSQDSPCGSTTASDEAASPAPSVSPQTPAPAAPAQGQHPEVPPGLAGQRKVSKPSPATPPEAPPLAPGQLLASPPGLAEPRKAQPLGAPAGLKAQRLAAPPGLVEPRKVALPTSIPTMAAALAAANSPEAIAAARRATYAPMSRAVAREPAMAASACEPAAAVPPVPESRPSATPWSAFRTPEERPSQGFSFASSLGRVSLFDDEQPGALTAGESLQRSLEQLLRQQSMRLAAAEGARARGQEEQAAC